MAAAKMFDVSKRTVIRAKRVLEKASPEQIAAIESGGATTARRSGK
jgi:transposase